LKFIQTKHQHRLALGCHPLERPVRGSSVGDGGTRPAPWPLGAPRVSHGPDYTVVKHAANRLV
jgi:hypothetical protein